MKTLETEIKKNGYKYRQIWREKDIAVYEYNNGRHELVIIRTRKAETMHDGYSFPDREVYPKISDWGQYGWTLGRQDRELAIYIGKQIVNLPATNRIPKIHEIMDHWIKTRKELQSVAGKAIHGSPGAFNPNLGVHQGGDS